MKKVYLFIFVSGLLFLNIDLFGQLIKAQWAENLWANPVPGTQMDNLNTTAYSATMCSDGSFYATFSFFDSIKVGNNYYNAKGSEDLMIAKYTRTKQLLWVYSIHSGMKHSFNLKRVFLGENNSIYIGLNYTMPITLGADTILQTVNGTSGNNNYLVIKLGADGKYNWVVRFASPSVILCKGYFEGFLALDSYGYITHNGITYFDRSTLHFNKSGILDFVLDSVCTLYEDILTNSDTDAFIRGSTLFSGMNVRVGTDTVKSIIGKTGYYACISKKGHKTKWIYTIENKGYDAAGTTEAKMVLDKFGNSYYVDAIGGDSVKVENKWYHFFKSSYYNCLIQLDKNGKYKNFICDSMPNPGDNQTMNVSLSADSTKLLLSVYSMYGFWFPGVGNFPGGGCMLFVLDITQNLKCLKYYSLNNSYSPNRNRIYSPNPWNIPSYAISRGLALIANLQTDTINSINTGGNNVAIIYFSDKQNTGFERIADNSYVLIYPNPCSGMLYFKGCVINELQIMDISGRVIETPLMNDQSGINLSELQKGVYFIRINSSKSFKIIRL